MNPDTDKGSDKGFVLTFLALIILAVIFLGGYYFYQKYRDDNTKNDTDNIDTRDEEDSNSNNNEENNDSETNNVYEVVSEQDNLSKITQAIDDANLQSTLQNLSQNFTLFLPQDSALENVTLPESSEELSVFIKAHVVSQKISVEEIMQEPELVLTNLNNEQITAKVEGGDLVVNDIEIVEVGIEGGNGTIYIINGVIE